MTHETLDLVGHVVIHGRGEGILREEGFQQGSARGVLLRREPQGTRLTRNTIYGAVEKLKFQLSR